VFFFFINSSSFYFLFFVFSFLVFNLFQHNFLTKRLRNSYLFLKIFINGKCAGAAFLEDIFLGALLALVLQKEYECVIQKEKNKEGRSDNHHALLYLLKSSYGHTAASFFTV